MIGEGAVEGQAREGKLESICKSFSGAGTSHVWRKLTVREVTFPILWTFMKADGQIKSCASGRLLHTSDALSTFVRIITRRRARTSLTSVEIGKVLYSSSRFFGSNCIIPPLTSTQVEQDITRDGSAYLLPRWMR